ncbi:MAG: hypothetical protein HGB26_03195 [Desulfobulbaceae bacterium]|nr:hypothetical protein [Desulfobulbaceae bacterium]
MMTDHTKIKDVVFKYINTLSKEELETYVGEFDVDAADAKTEMSLGISEYAMLRDYEKVSRVLSILKNSMCSNQGQLIQFMFLAAEKHKALRLCWDSVSQHDIEELKTLVVDLRDYVDNYVKRVIETNIQYLYQYFHDRDGATPRICIKGKSFIDGNPKIVRVFSDDLVEYDSDIDIEKSTAYKFIETNGQYFLQNNIPDAASIGEYQNARFDYDKINALVLDNIDLNNAWERCWKKHEDYKGDKTSFYKSTLVIPVTLLNNKLDYEFVYEFNSKIDSGVGKSELNPNEIERTIFAFLCIDHVDRWYFNEDADVKVGYVIADFMSYYIFLRTMYMEVSDVFKNACDYLKSHKISLPVDKRVYASADELAVNCLLNSKEEYEKTTNNLIASLDMHSY